MTIDDYHKMMEEQYAALDQIDFEPYLEKFGGKTLDDLMEAVRDDYNNTDLSNTELLQGCIFNVCNDSELADYLEERYKGKFHTWEYTVFGFSYDK